MCIFQSATKWNGNTYCRQCISADLVDALRSLCPVYFLYLQNVTPWQASAPCASSIWNEHRTKLNLEHENIREKSYLLI